MNGGAPLQFGYGPHPSPGMTASGAAKLRPSVALARAFAFGIKQKPDILHERATIYIDTEGERLIIIQHF
jgi:hypothetical protein